MTLSEENLIRLAEYAMEAARKAGTHISETRPVKVQRKVGGESLASQVLTEVDQQSQDLILDVLEPTFSEYDLALLTEESEDDGSRLKKDYFWCIDPIDGTLPFIEGRPGYAVSIALVSRAGKPMIGVIYNPIEHTAYHAILGKGVFRNGVPWEPDLSRKDGSIRIFTERSEAEGPLFESVARSMNAEWGSFGGAVMNAIWCLEHPPACYFKLPKPKNGGGCFWDFAATACIYNELGAPAADIAGIPLKLNRPESTYMNLTGVLYATDAELAKQVADIIKTQSA